MVRLKWTVFILFRKKCESYKSVVWEMKYICDSILWIMMSSFSHIYIYWYLLMAQVEDVLLVVTFYLRFFLYWDTRWFFYWGNWFFCFRKNDINLIIYLIEEKWWLNSWGGGWLRNTRSRLIEILNGIKIYMPDIIYWDIWIITCSLENNWQYISSLDKNCEPSCQ